MSISDPDPRYVTIRRLLELGHITRFEQIFDVIPHSRMAVDMGKNYTRFGQKIANPGNFMMKEICQMAELLGIEKEAMASLVLKSVAQSKVENKDRQTDSNCP